MKVVFFGTSDYCLPVLEALHKNFNLKLVITRPDKPVGRKKILTASATKIWAEKHHIPVATPETLKKDTPDRINVIKLITAISPDLAVVADYGLIIPEEIFKLPKLGTINIHFSKLPDLRGPSPVQSTLLRGDQEAWTTIFKLDNPADLPVKMDSGPIILQKPFPIDANDTTQTLYTKLFADIAKQLPDIIRKFADGTIKLLPQDHAKATFTKLLTREDGFVKWDELKAPENYNKFRAYCPWPGLWTVHPSGKRMKILKCHLGGEKLILDQIQFAGEKPRAPYLFSSGG